MASFISTHSLTRRLTEHPIEYIQAMLFQLTASQGGWRIGSNERKYQWYFNSQPHKEADVVARTVLFAYRKFQLTASQGGWPWTPPTVTSRRTISTHSLTRRLTRTAERYHRSGCISTHSLTRRLTGKRIAGSQQSSISTHSLTRRLTSICENLVEMGVFQLTASQGGWR